MGWDEHSKLQYPCPKWDPAFVFSSREVISKSLESFAWWVSAFGQGPVAMLGNLMIWFLMEALDLAVVVLLPEESDPEVSHMGSPPCLHGWVPGKALDQSFSELHWLALFCECLQHLCWESEHCPRRCREEQLKALPAHSFLHCLLCLFFWMTLSRILSLK